MDGARRMLGRRVDRVEPKIGLAGVHEVVAGPGRHMDESVDRDGALLAIQDGLSFALNENQHLVHVRVDLGADVSARRNAHNDDLAVRSSRQDLAKVRVSLRPTDDVLVESHACTPFLHAGCSRLEPPGTGCSVKTHSTTVCDCSRMNCWT